MTTSQIHALMTQIGPTLALDDVTASGEEASWLLLRGETALVIDFDEERQSLAFVATVDPVSAPDATAVYKLMLNYNALAHATGGARLALEPTTGDVQFLVDLPVADLDLPFFSAVVEEVFDKADTWNDIASGRFVASGSLDSLPPDLTHPAFLRA